MNDIYILTYRIHETSPLQIQIGDVNRDQILNAAIFYLFLIVVELLFGEFKRKRNLTCL